MPRRPSSESIDGATPKVCDDSAGFCIKQAEHFHHCPPPPPDDCSDGMPVHTVSFPGTLTSAIRVMSFERYSSSFFCSSALRSRTRLALIAFNSFGREVSNSYEYTANSPFAVQRTNCRYSLSISADCDAEDSSRHCDSICRIRLASSPIFRAVIRNTR